MTECSSSRCEEDANYTGRPPAEEEDFSRELCRDCAMELSAIGSWDVRQKEAGEP